MPHHESRTIIACFELGQCCRLWYVLLSRCLSPLFVGHLTIHDPSTFAFTIEHIISTLYPHLLFVFLLTGMTAAGTIDTFAVVTQIATEEGKTPRVLGKTEVVENSLSPTWAQKFIFDYELGTPCRLAVSVFHRASGSAESKSIGSALFDVASTVGCRGSTKAKKIKGGTLYATIRQSEGSGTFSFKFRGEKVSYFAGPQPSYVSL